MKRSPLLVIASIPLLLFLLLPLAALFARTSVESFVTNLTNPLVSQAILLSVLTCSCATLLAVLLGTPLAYLLSRRVFTGKSLVDALVDLPMVLPPAVAGVALLMMFGRKGILGQYLNAIGISIPFTEMAVILAQLFVAAPYFVKSAASGFSGVARELEQAARVDGATSWQTFRRVTLPLAMPSILGGAFMAWARALGEFGATIIFAGNLPGRTQTMPLAIYLGFEMDLDVALTLAVMLLVASFMVLTIVRAVLKQTIGQK